MVLCSKLRSFCYKMPNKKHELFEWKFPTYAAICYMWINFVTITNVIYLVSYITYTPRVQLSMRTQHNAANVCGRAAFRPPDPCSFGSQYPCFVKGFEILVFVGLLTILVLNLMHRLDRTDKALCIINADLDDMKRNLSNLTSDEAIGRQVDVQSKLNELGEVIAQLVEANIKLRDDILAEISEIRLLLLQHLDPDQEKVKLLLREALSEYSADKTGRTDFALESAGGSIISIRSTETYLAGAPTLSLFGISLCTASNSPRTIIQASSLPGECWAFHGTSGSVVIQLLGKVKINGTSLEHIPATISPTGEVSTAPKEFSLWGLNSLDDKEGFFFGQFIYDIEGPPVQFYAVNETPHSYSIVELKIHSNHGNNEYTCIYRIRIHGVLDGRPL